MNNIESEEQLCDALKQNEPEVEDSEVEERPPLIEENQDIESEITEVADEAEEAENNFDHAKPVSRVHCSICDVTYAGEKTCVECDIVCHPRCSTHIGDQYMCQVCTKTRDRDQQREGAHLKQAEQAESMKNSSNMRFPPASTGSSVLIPIPDVDRQRCDFRNVQGVVTYSEDGNYTIGIKHGVLDGKYMRNQFTVCKGSFLLEDDVPPRKKSLREIARADSLGSGQGFSRCNCLQG